MKYDNTAGAWLKAENVTDGAKVKLVNECVKKESNFKNEDGSPKTENVVKARFQGAEDSVNMRLNWTTVYGLIEAFGDDSKDWIGKILTAKTKDATTGVSVYLIPEGFDLVRNKETKRWTIVKAGGVQEEEEVNPREQEDPLEQEMYPEEEINPADIPF